MNINLILYYIIASILLISSVAFFLYLLLSKINTDKETIKKEMQHLKSGNLFTGTTKLKKIFKYFTPLYLIAFLLPFIINVLNKLSFINIHFETQFNIILSIGLILIVSLIIIVVYYRNK